MDTKVLIVIDIQNDFVDSNNIHILDKISELIYSNKYDDVVFTRFINDTESIWYKKLDYKGCITEEGRRIAKDPNVKGYNNMDDLRAALEEWNTKSNLPLNLRKI